MADWSKIKTEYITTDTSYRKLAEKYGIDQATISRKAKKEDWVSKRQQHISRMQAKVQQAVEGRKVDRAAKLLDASDKLLQKVMERVEALDALEMSSQEFRHLSATIKDIKEIQMIRSDADMREQNARIKNLEKQAEAQDEDKDKKVTVTITGGEESWRR